MAADSHQGIQKVGLVLCTVCQPPSPSRMPKNQIPQEQQGHKVREPGLLNHYLARRIADQEHPHCTVTYTRRKLLQWTFS